jgi:hypothetical protein
MPNIIYEKESYQIIGACIEVHKELGILINFGEKSLKYKRLII